MQVIEFTMKEDQINIIVQISKRHRRQIFKLLIQSFVSIFLQNPHDGFLHESTLLDRYRDKVFVDGQSFKPYYLSILLFLKADSFFKNNFEIYRDVRAFKFQIVCLLAEVIAGIIPNINDNRKIEFICDKILDIINDEIKFAKEIDNVVNVFMATQSAWITQKGDNFKYAIKDNAEFTIFMLTRLRGGSTANLTKTQELSTYRGVVTTVKKDRNELFYAFIKRYPIDVFVHEDDCSSINFHQLEGKSVIYAITPSRTTPQNGPRGVIQEVISD